MVEYKGTYYIDVRPETVFEYMNDAENAVDATPSLTTAEVLDANLPNGCEKIEAEYEFGGLMSGKLILTAVEHNPPKCIRFDISGDVSGYVEWRFEEDGDGTLFTYETDYDPDVPAPSFVVNKIGSTLNEKEVKQFIRNLRSDLEP